MKIPTLISYLSETMVARVSLEKEFGKECRRIVGPEARFYEICCCGVQWLGWPTTPVARPWVAGNREENMEMQATDSGD